MKQLQISACEWSRALDCRWCRLNRCFTLNLYQSSESPPFTWMSSSLELNSDTSTFSPSDTLVSDTHSRPEASRWASEGRSRSRPDFITLTRLKEGWRGPRFLLRASFATWMTSSQHFAAERITTTKCWDLWSHCVYGQSQRTVYLEVSTYACFDTGNRYQESLTSSDLWQIALHRKSSASRWLMFTR